MVRICLVSVTFAAVVRYTLVHIHIRTMNTTHHHTEYRTLLKYNRLLYCFGDEAAMNVSHRCLSLSTFFFYYYLYFNPVYFFF